MRKYDFFDRNFTVLRIEVSAGNLHREGILQRPGEHRVVFLVE